MSQPTARRPALGLLIIAFVAFVMIGLVDGALGVAWPSMRSAFDRSVADLGLLLAIGSVGYLTASATYGSLHARMGTGRLLGFGSVLLAGALAAIALAPVWWVIAGSVVLLGLGGALVDVGMNAHAALAFDIRSINLLHACFGVGATLGPIVITVSLMSTGVWRSGYFALAGLQLLVAVVIWRRRRNFASGEHSEDVDTGGVPGRSQAWILAVLFFLYTGIEIGTGQWAFTLLTEGRGMATAAAGTWVAVFWGGLTVGRLGFGIVGDRLSPHRVLSASVLVSLLGVAILWLDPAGHGTLGLPFAGLGMAAVFPTLVSVTPSRIGRDRSTRSIGYQLAAASLGASAIPWLLGAVAAMSDLEALAAGLFVTTSVLAAVFFLSERTGRG